MCDVNPLVIFFPSEFFVILITSTYLKMLHIYIEIRECKPFLNIKFNQDRLFFI